MLLEYKIGQFARCSASFTVRLCRTAITVFICNSLYFMIIVLGE
jgi:hypothetical protein